MPTMRNPMYVCCAFLGHLYAHEIVLNPDPLSLSFGGPDGIISLLIVGNEPTKDCNVVMTARPKTDLVSLARVGTQPAPEVALSVHALRQPQGQSESTTITGSWAGVNIPIAACSDGPFPFTLTVTVTRSRDQPVISTGGVISASSYGAFSAITSGGFVEIYGTNLANGTGDWGASFKNGVAPTSLSDVTVQIDGKAAFVSFVSPRQVNVQAPDGLSVGGTVMVTLSNLSGASDPVAVRSASLQPGLLAPADFKLNGKQYVTAFLPDGNYALPIGAIGNSRPARPGEVIVIYGLGFGPVIPPIASGTLETLNNTLQNPLQMSFGGVAAMLQFDGLAPNYAGLYQFNVQVPAVADNDAVPVTFSLGGVPGEQALYIAVRAQ
jgi:uncharacterized protein (TIGR03437 family)